MQLTLHQVEQLCNLVGAFNLDVAVDGDRLGFYNYLIQGYIDNTYTDDKQLYLFIDRKGIMDKYSRCPIQLPFPENEEQFQYLCSAINWLCTFDGYKASKSYIEDKWITSYED